MFAQTSLRELSDLLLAYAPQPSFDDMAWFALAYARVYETDKTLIDFLRVSKDIYHWIWINGWDETGTQIMVVAVLSHKHKFPYLLRRTREASIYILLLVCGGGVWFDQAETGKETIENAQLFQLALKLARLEQELEQRNGK